MVVMVLHLHPHLHLDRSRERALFDCKTAGVRSPDIRHHPTDVRTEMDVDSFIRRTVSLAGTTKSHFDETARTMTGMVAKTLAHRQQHLVVTEPFMTCPAHGHLGLGTILETPTTNIAIVTNMLTIQPSPEHSRTPNAPALPGSTSQDPHASSRTQANRTTSISVPKTPQRSAITNLWSATTGSNVRSACDSTVNSSATYLGHPGIWMSEWMIRSAFTVD